MATSASTGRRAHRFAAELRHDYIEAIHAYSLFRGEVVTFAYEQWYRDASELRGAEGGFKRAVALMEPRSYWQRRPVADLLG